MWVRALEVRQKLLIFELSYSDIRMLLKLQRRRLMSRVQHTISKKVILPCFRFSQETILLRKLLLTRVANLAFKHLIPLPVNLQSSTLPADFLAVLLKNTDGRLKRASLLV